MKKRTWAAHVWMPVVVTFVVGCGAGDLPELGEVKGIVTLDGDPVERAYLLFVPEQDAEVKVLAYGVTDAEGRYQAIFRDNVDGVPTGPRKVQIYSDEGTTWRGLEFVANGRREFFPRKYNQRTQLTLDVKPGENEQDFHCKTTP